MTGTGDIYRGMHRTVAANAPAAPANAVAHGPAASETPGAGAGKVVVLGNEKGGTGKSTTAMHLIVALLREGKSVASVDLDVH